MKNARKIVARDVYQLGFGQKSISRQDRAERVQTLLTLNRWHCHPLGQSEDGLHFCHDAAAELLYMFFEHDCVHWIQECYLELLSGATVCLAATTLFHALSEYQGGQDYPIQTKFTSSAYICKSTVLKRMVIITYSYPEAMYDHLKSAWDQHPTETSNTYKQFTSTPYEQKNTKLSRK